MADHATAHPPRARMAFRVGVVGHRPNRLPKSKKGLAAIELQIRTVLAEVGLAIEEFRATDEAKLYSPDDPLLRAVSPLAEGTDRIFAKAALDRGYALCVPMPFARAEYEKDFKTRESIDEFSTILARAAEIGLTTFELHQPRGATIEEQGSPYGAAGRLVVDQSDLLVAVWDGKKGRGKGGTVTTMKQAVGFRLPVLHIDARPPYACSLIESDDDIESCIRTRCAAKPLDAAALRVEIVRIVRGEIALPRPNPRQETAAEPAQPEDQPNPIEASKGARDYFAEKQPRFNLGFWWKPFRNVMAGHLPGMPNFFVCNFVESVREKWPVKPEELPRKSNEPPPTEMAAWVNGQLREHYAWADGLAGHYADAHRSGFLWTSILAAAAVFFALAPVTAFGFPLPEEDIGIDIAYVLFEAVVLGALFFVILRGRSRKWHERWLEYRMLAEWVRQLRLVIPMGGARPLMRTPAHLAVYGDPQRSWAYWHVRAIARETGIPTAEGDADYVRDCLDFLARTVADEARGQLQFHTESKERSERIHHVLHRVTTGLVAVTIASVAFHLWSAWWREPPSLPFCIDTYTIECMLLLFSAGLPAASAALANIDNQGEFARISKRSRSMADAFGHFGGQVKKLADRFPTPAPPTMAEVTSLASQVAKSMVEEVVDWRIVAIDLPHEPG